MTVKAKLSEFAETTSTHGIAHINSTSKWFLKVFWTIVVAGGIVICVWYIWSAVVVFLQFPVLVQTEIKFEKLPFPAVTICNLNPIRASKLHLVPKLEQLMNVCTLSPDKNSTATPIDFCKMYRERSAAAIRRKVGPDE